LIERVERVNPLSNNRFKGVNMRKQGKKRGKKHNLRNQHDRVEWSEEFKKAQERDAEAKEGRE